MFSLFKVPLYYVQIKKNSFNIRSVKDAKTIVFDATTPFSSDRLLVAEFKVAEKLLTKALASFSKSLLRPTLIMHPLELVGETLSEVEEQLLRELALSAGAYKVKFWLGEPLDDHDLQ